MVYWVVGGFFLCYTVGMFVGFLFFYPMGRERERMDVRTRKAAEYINEKYRQYLISLAINLFPNDNARINSLSIDRLEHLLNHYSVSFNSDLKITKV
jgi:hypothetical protein